MSDRRGHVGRSRHGSREGRCLQRTHGTRPIGAVAGHARRRSGRHLPNLQFAFNTARHTSTRETPFFLNCGRHPVVPSSLIGDAPSTSDVRVPAAQQFLEVLRESLKKAKVHLEESRQRQKRQADLHRQDQRYAVGDRVLLSTANMPVPRNLTRKLSRLYAGPFTVEKVVSDNAYRLKLPESVRMHPVFNVSQLRPYIDPSEKFPGRTVEPSPPVVVGDEEEWGVPERSRRTSRRPLPKF